MKDVYSIEDLESREIIDAGSDKPAKLAVIGDPVKHSKSPEMHQASLDAQDFDIRYIRVHVKPGSVKAALQKMEALGFIGVNVTVPHKFEVMQACDTLTEAAKQIGAVNTVHFTQEGWLGHNTDGPGLANAVDQELGKTFSNSKTLIIGAGGGAGRAIAIQAALDKCPKLTLANRTVSKLDEIAEKVKDIYPECDLHLISNNDEDLAAADAELIVNATSLGMKEEDALPFPEKAITSDHVFYDAVYSPPVTALLKAAKTKGCKIANGHSMLVHQGALSYEMWLGKNADLQLMANALK